MITLDPDIPEGRAAILTIARDILRQLPGSAATVDNALRLADWILGEVD